MTDAPSAPASDARGPRLIFGLGATIVIALIGCVAVAWPEDSLIVQRQRLGDPRWSYAFIVLLASAYSAYVVAAWLAARARISTRLVLRFAITIQLVPLAAPLLATTDAWSYWAYARIAAVHDQNPYVQVPADFPFDPAFEHLAPHWIHTPSVYGPVFTLASEPVASTSSAAIAAWAFKAIAAIAMIAAILGVSRLSRRAALAVVVLGWSPLVAVQAAGGGHNDAWVAALTIGALVAAAGHRYAIAGAGWALAVLIKWVPLSLVPLLAIAIAARAHAGARSSRMVLRAVAGFIAVAVLGSGVATWRYGVHWLGAFETIGHNSQVPSGAALGARLHQLGVSQAVASMVPLGLLAVGGVFLLREAFRGRARLGLAAIVIVGCSPILHPWYLLWAMPLAVADDDTLAIVLSIVLGAVLLGSGIKY